MGRAVYGFSVANYVRAMLDQLRLVRGYSLRIGIGLCESRLEDQAGSKSQVGKFHLVTSPWCVGRV